MGPLLFLIYIDGLSGIQLSSGSIDDLLHHLITCFEDFQNNYIDEMVIIQHITESKKTKVLAHFQEKASNCFTYPSCE